MRIHQIPNKQVEAVIQEKIKDAAIPGAVIPFTQEEYELAGGFDEEAIDFDEARISSVYALEK